MINIIKNAYLIEAQRIEEENNVENLIGRRVLWLREGWPENNTYGVVAGIAEGVGFTITSEVDKTNNLICYNGPLSPAHSHDGFEKAFTYGVEAIKAGVFDCDDMLKQTFYTDYYGNGGTQSQCSFK